MSIQDVIADLEQDRRLVLVLPRMPGSAHPRLIYAAPIVQAQLANADYRIGELRSDLDHFSTGGKIVVCSGKEKHGYMKLLDKESEQVWEIRSRDPKPSLRVFGRFAITDIYVATHICDRKYLGIEGSKEWRDEIERSKAEWTKLFGTYRPLQGKSPNDYISTNVVRFRDLK